MNNNNNNRNNVINLNEGEEFSDQYSELSNLDPIQEEEVISEEELQEEDENIHVETDLTFPSEQ